MGYNEWQPVNYSVTEDEDFEIVKQRVDLFGI